MTEMDRAERKRRSALSSMDAGGHEERARRRGGLHVALRVLAGAKGSDWKVQDRRKARVYCF
jgi:hypothetical protein